MADEPADTPDTVSWGGQDGFEIQSEGMENEWYKGGAQEVYDKLDATYVLGESLEVVAGAVTNFVAGAEVSAVAGLKLDLALAPKIEWQPIPFAVELHGLSHWRTAFGDAWHHQHTDFSATSVGAHTQIVLGPSTWEATTSTWSALTKMTLSAREKLSCSGLSVAINAQSSCAIDGGATTTVSSKTKTQVSGGTSSLLLNAAEATLATSSGGGIKATAAQTVISGTKVMIGIPGGPPPAPVATQTQIAHLSQQVDMLGDKITNLEKELKTLEVRTRSKPVQAKKIAGQLRAPGPKKIH